MTSSNLIPTPIVNKNGVHTTVYKAAGGSSSSAVGNLPAPSVAGAVSGTAVVSSEIMEGLYLTFTDPYIVMPGHITGSLIQRTLDGYDSDTQKYIREVQQNNPEDGYFDRMLISMLSRRESPEMIETALFVYDNLQDQWDAMTFNDGWNDDNVFDVDYDLIRKVNGASQYPISGYRFGLEDYSLRHYDEHTQKQTLALIALCLDLDMDDKLRSGVQYDDDSVYLADEATAQVLIREPERLAEVLVALQKHGRTDWGVVEAMENAPSVPLREGTL